jgi:hypothetical protein
MDANKIREIISELQADIDLRQQAVKALEKLLLSTAGATGDQLVAQQDNVKAILFGSTDSYIDLAVKTINANENKPTSIKQIVERIRVLKGNPNISRRSVEASIFRHIAVKGDMARLLKVGPGKYTVRRFPREEHAA